jgi:tetratricopeptide (TPR) repeat protein
MAQDSTLRQRAATLYNLRRFGDAEQAFREILISQPEDAWAHAFLARAIGNLQKKERLDEALREAQAAIHADPNYAEGYFSLALIQFYRAPAEAEQALNDAIRLEPENSHFYALLGQLHLFTAQPEKALDFALAGRLVDPLDVACANIEAVALMRLGRGKDAKRVIREALRANPEDAQAHAARGWTLLAEGQNELARVSFGEALRLNPKLENAREGLVEGYKSRVSIYAFLLRFLLYWDQQSWYIRSLVVLGVTGLTFATVIWWVGTFPKAAIWAMPLFYIPILFALGLGMARPVFSLFLRFDKYARLSLSREQIIQGNWVVASLAAILLGILTGIFSGSPTCGGIVLLAVLLGCWPFLGTADPRVRKDEMRPY